MEQTSRIGMDTSKHIFQLHGVNAAEDPVPCAFCGGEVRGARCAEDAEGHYRLPSAGVNSVLRVAQPSK